MHPFDSDRRHRIGFGSCLGSTAGMIIDTRRARDVKEKNTTRADLVILILENSRIESRIG